MNASAVAGVVDAVPRSAPAATIFLAIGRATAVLFFSLCALIEIAAIVPFVRGANRVHARAAWLHVWCCFACRVLGIHVTSRGSMPRSGLLVCNHLSYLDIIVLSSITPCVFVAKANVAAWPLFGWLTRAAGTIFADRRRKLSAAAAIEEIREAMAEGALVVLFPEGTSSDGSGILPFKSALLQPALDLGCNITAAAIDYSVSGGSVADEICYWRDMTLVPHLLNLFTKPAIKSKLIVAPFVFRCSDRKEIARALREQIAAMRS
jgi:lyso-ornithine lipid O-acyltransferase